MDQLMTEEEVAEWLRISPITLAEYRKKKKGPPHIKIGGTIRYSKQTLIDWLKSKEE